ncbi:methyl-accepting chemotaxis protein [Pseudomonas sp. gcc21]|uniref:methyl-accepting chemotaxis protein n=1 Tax=Pseudomonas sp. gcc21 TaxID=2726989 RepID=UPI0014529BBF|nr:methyl-accepting chemotaxis protein [Pseudomonas sp. gcc21]QJD58766.1 methyl-accepting chemotaxis protein [Pseudomonas sp. gcc21]
MNSRNFPVAARLTGGFAAVALIVLMLGFLAVQGMSNMREEATEIEQLWLPSMQDIGEFNQDFMRLRIFTFRALLAEDNREIQQLNQSMDELERLLTQAEQAFEQRISSAESQQAFNLYKAQRTEYMRLQAQVMQRIAQGNLDGAMGIVQNQLNPQADVATQSLIALEDLIIAGAGESAESAELIYERGFRQVILFIAIAAVLTVLLAWLITRSIVAPIREAVRISEVIATGDLTQRFQVEGKDEPARLLRALSAMQTQLRDTIERITSSSTQLASAAEELNAVTEDSTRGLQRQNDEIQQAATAVNEMSAAVDEVAGNAVSTSEQSQATASVASEGQQQVVYTVTSIDKLSGSIQSTATEVQELAEKAQNISRVLEVIRAIAEQTNLLALNAAIEAARAGDHGRGFAVVADEVRALAYRTQQSTAEIEDMIGTIQQGTERAVEAMQISNTMASNTLGQAESAGEALNRITAAINQINERNLVIASAAEEQAQVAREVDRNLENIRDLSTQSAAGAEQTSCSSRELSRLAVELNDLVTRFTI